MELIQEIAAIIFLLVLGSLMLIRPDIVWKLEHFLSVKDGEPTDLYLGTTRLIGLGCICVAVLATVVFICL